MSLLDHHPHLQPVTNMQTLQYLQLTNDQRGRFTEDQSAAGVVIAKAPHARGWDISELRVLKHAGHCERVLAIRPTGANCSGYIVSETVTVFHGAV